jgi:hypothetical protein
MAQMSGHTTSGHIKFSSTAISGTALSFAQGTAKKALVMETRRQRKPSDFH